MEDIIVSKHHSKPIVFGSITNWKAFWTLRFEKYVLAEIHSDSKSREIIKEHLFDQTNYDIKDNFHQSWLHLFDVFQRIVEEKEPLIVGYEMNNFSKPVPNKNKKFQDYEYKLRK
jgi:hypothetical protein